MIPDIREIKWPDYATLSSAEAQLADMGEKNVTAQVKIADDIVPDFSKPWAIEYGGEKYYMPLRLPAASVGSESKQSTIDLTFQHWAIYQLKRYPFVTIQTINAGTYIADEEVADVQVNARDFCILLGQVLEYYYGNQITVDIHEGVSGEVEVLSISHTLIWDVLTNVLQDKYGLHWEIVAAEDNNNDTEGGERYVIKVGYPVETIDHIFEYDCEDGGILKFERQMQSEDIRNMLKGRGGEKNLPKYYFKKSSDETQWASDPDWVEELANIYFANLMPATFRSYVRGWKYARKANYTGWEYASKTYAELYQLTGTQLGTDAQEAFAKGYADTKFRPIEYVKDDESIAKYGELMATLDNNDEIYPSIQGSGVDDTTYFEQVTSDDIEESVEKESIITDISGNVLSVTANNVAAGAYRNVTTEPSDVFEIPSGLTGNLDVQGMITRVSDVDDGYKSLNIDTSAEIVSVTLKAYNVSTGAEHSAAGIPAGKWRYKVTFRVHNLAEDKKVNIRVTTTNATLLTGDVSGEWTNTFEIRVKNIWGTTKNASESDAQYAERVWKPILGDRVGNEAMVMFTSGALVHEDYEFVIVEYPKYISDATEQSKGRYWSIKLAKSEAEYEATGKYLPSTQKQGKEGDTFVFIGIDMPHTYVLFAEKRLDDYKRDELQDVKDIMPTYTATLDRVKINNGGAADALIHQLKIGNKLRLADKRFIAAAYETLTIQSVTRKYREPSSEDAALNPDVDIVLSNEYAATGTTLNTMQGDITALQRQLGSLSSIESVIRAIGDKLYLRKDGISERSLSPTQFVSLLTSADFRNGIVGGRGWGFYQDENGNWVLEADRINVRQEMQVTTLVINQATARGGMEIDTAAYMEVTKVEKIGNCYRCYFDQKGGTVANLFQVNDIAYNTTFTAENAALKFYKRLVKSVGENYIDLSDASGEKNGSGVPEVDDIIIHYGNTKNALRQYVKVRDVVGGGYERYIEGLNSVTAAGEEYYFVGRQTGMYNNKPRFFIGGKNSYVEWVDGELNIRGKISAQSTIGNKTIGEYIDDAVDGKVDEASLYLLDLDNEMSGMICDSDGKVTGDYPTVTASVYKGSTKLTSGVTYSIASKSGITTTSVTSAGVVTMSGMTADAATITVQAVVGDVTLNASISLYKIIPGTNGDNYSNNILLKSDVVAEKSSYLVQAYNFADGQAPQAGDDVTITIWGELGEGKTSFSAYNSGGNVIIGYLSKISDGLYSLQTTWKVVNGSTTAANTYLNIYAYPSSVSATSRIDKIKLELGKNNNPVWTPNSTEMKGKDGKDGENGKDGINGVDGKDGAAAVMYTLQPSVNNIVRHFDGTLSSTSLTCAVYKTTGDSIYALTSEKTLKYQRLPSETWTTLAHENGVSSAVNVLEDTTAIVFALYDENNNLLDRERVPVLSDASDLAIGGTNLLRNTNQGRKNWSATIYPSEQAPNAIIVSDMGVYPFGVAFTNTNTPTSTSGMYYYLRFRANAEGGPYNVKIKSGKVYTLSCDIELVGEGTFTLAPHITNISPSKDIIPTAKTYKFENIDGEQAMRCIWTFTTTEDLDQVGYIYLMLSVANASTNLWTDCAVTNLKLEEGNVATEWSMSPYDVNYLIEALQESTTIDGGLILASLIKLGYTDANGNWKVGAGINGLLGSDGGTDAAQRIMLWSGGDQIDAAESPTSADAATFLVRRDGTFYAANNVLRFLKDRMEVGSDITLDEQGLHLRDTESNSEMLTISTEQVGDLVDLIRSTQVAITYTETTPNFKFNRRTSISAVSEAAEIAAQAGEDIDISLPTGYYLCEVDSMTIALNGGNVVLINGSTFNLDLQFRVVAYMEDMANFDADLRLTLQKSNNDITWSDVQTYYAGVDSNINTHTLSFKLTNVALPTGYRYRLVLSAHNSMSATPNITLTPTMSISGKVIGGSQNKTVGGANGFASSWNGAAILVKSGYAGMIAGNFGIQCVKDVGLQVTNDGTTWKTIDFAKLASLGII